MARRKAQDTSTTPALFSSEELPVVTRKQDARGIAFPVGEPDPEMTIVLNADGQNTDLVLAQQIFVEMLGHQQTFEVDKSPTDFGYRKSTALLDTSELSLVARRIANAICYVVSQNPQHSKHDIDLGFLRWLIRFSSRNKQHFIEALKECGKVRLFIANVDGYDRDAFASVSIFPSIAFNGTSRIVVEVADILRKQLNGPRLYSFLSLRNLAKLDSAYATILYERLVHYVFRGQTDWMTPEEFRMWFRDEEGNPCARDWKYIKRDIIDIAVRQINENTNIEVSPVINTKGRGGRVSQLMFTVKEIHKVADDPKLRSQTYDMLRNEFGLTDTDFNKLTESMDEITDADLQRAMDYTRRAVETATPDNPIKRVNKYLMWAIANPDKTFVPELELKQRAKALMATSPSEQSETTKKVEVAGADKNAQIEAASLEAIEYFKGSDSDEQEQLLTAFKASQVFRLNRRRVPVLTSDLTVEAALTDPSCLPVFGTFLAAALNPPSDTSTSQPGR